MILSHVSAIGILRNMRGFERAMRKVRSSDTKKGILLCRLRAPARHSCGQCSKPSMRSARARLVLGTLAESWMLAACRARIRPERERMARLRVEAHRFAIQGHRARRGKARRAR